MRRIDEVTDDEIVDCIAECGLEGFDIRHLDKAVERLRIAGPASGALENRMYVMYRDTDRVYRHDDVYYLTHIEWGRRLAGKSAEDIARALHGTHSYWS